MLKKSPYIILTFFLLSFCLFISCKKENSLLEKIDAYDTSHTINWMQDILEVYPNATLKDLSIPRAHDAGVYEVNNCLLGNACNVQTQYLDMKGMLESGIRVFDVRPVLRNGVFWTYHATACNGAGCDGDNFENFLQQTKDYLDNHNELVIFEITQLCNTDAQDAVFLNLLSSILQDRIYKDDGSVSISFIDRPLNDILGLNTTKGKIVLQIQGLSGATENRGEGYFSPSYIDITGAYANKYIFEEMLADQKTKFNNHDETRDALFRLSFTLTLSDSLAFACVGSENPTSIEDLALDARTKIASTFDGWIAEGTIVKGKVPNILSVDFANTTITEQCIKISEFNLE